MPPTILSSPLLTLPVLNTLLNNPALTPIDRIPLLHAKITLLTNQLSTSASAVGSASAAGSRPASSSDRPTASGSQPNDPFTPIPRSSPADAERTTTAESAPSEEDLDRLTDEIEARIEVAGLFMGLRPPRVVEAENELTIVEGRLKVLFKAVRAEEGTGPLEEGDKGSESRSGKSLSLERLRALRIRALNDLVGVEEALGREGRAKRWRELVSKLQEEAA